MTQVFGKDYSTSYDLLYEEKDYDSECDLLERIIKKHCTSKVRSILDLGCGTGNHTLRFAERGYEMTGVDRSNDMLDIARQKTRDKGLSCEFFESDIKAFDNSKKYDVVIMMFAVLGYHLENEEVIRALRTVRTHLKKGGLFICDVWYGPAVLHQKPCEKIRVIQREDTEIIRVSAGDLDSFHHCVDVRFHLWTIKKGRVCSKTSEDHSMRFFFPQEIPVLFDISGMEMKEIRAFPEWDRQPDDETWNVCVVGSAV